MTRRGYASPPASVRAGQRSLLSALCCPTIALVAGLSLSFACEPAAWLETRAEVHELHSTGITSLDCDEFASRELRLSLAFSDDAGRPMSQTNMPAALSVDGATDLPPSAMKVEGGTATLYPAPDVACAEGTPVGTPCPQDELAAAGFMCARLVDPPETCVGPSCFGDPECEAERCAVPIVCALDGFPLSVRDELPFAFDGQPGSAQSVILMMTAGGSVLGEQWDGAPNAEACSSDPLDLRVRGALALLFRLSHSLPGSSTEARLCMAEFGGLGEPDYLLGAEQECFQSTLRRGEGFELLQTQCNRLGYQEEVGGRSPWEAVRDASQRFAEFGANGERHIVLVTDGVTTADVRRARASLEPQRIEAAFLAARQAATAVHVIQFGRDTDPEICRYPTAAGPDAELARLACETGGSFNYVASAEDIEGVMDSVGRSILGRYSIGLDAPDLSEIPLGSYKAAFAFTAVVGDEQPVLEFAPPTFGRRDQRATIVNRGDCMDRPCLEGLACDPATGRCEAPIEPE